MSNISYKKIDPFADTETQELGYSDDWASSYKKIDPFADTETRLAGRAVAGRLALQKNRSVCGY